MRDPATLPRCDYPGSADEGRHGIQRLPVSLPPVDFSNAGKYRSERYTCVSIESWGSTRILELARTVAAAFVEREPINRHIMPPARSLPGLHQMVRTDPLGASAFGPWTKENIFFWFIRLLVLTDPSRPPDEIRLNHDVMRLSLAMQDGEGAVIGGAFNMTLSPPDEKQVLRTGDPFLTAIGPFIDPPLRLIGEQEEEALHALHEWYPSFYTAHREGRVGCHFLVARSPWLPSRDAFELVAASVERFRETGYRYIVTSATNQWTGAAFEVLGGTRVHFAPYRAARRVAESRQAPEDVVHSPDGFLSDKDSGSMFYVIRLG